MNKDVLCVEKKDLEDSLETIPSFMNEIIKVLKKAHDAAEGNELKDDMIFSKLDLRDNKDLFRLLININEKYIEVVPELKNKVEELVGKRICNNTSDVNLVLLMHMVSLGALLAYGSIATAIYAISKMDEKLKEILDNQPYIKTTHYKLTEDMINFLLVSEKADIKKITEVIGTIPHIDEDGIRDLVIVKKLNKMSLDGGVISYIKKLVNSATGLLKSHKTNDPYIKEFIGNPIYHFRLYLADLEVARLEKLKEEKRLLELYVLELKEKGDTKGIEFYQKKIDELDRKINAYMQYS